MLAPIVSFTAEEAWQFFASPNKFQASDETIFTRLFYQIPAVDGQQALLEKYATLRNIRLDVTKQLEEARAAGKIGAALPGRNHHPCLRRQTCGTQQPG